MNVPSRSSPSRRTARARSAAPAPVTGLLPMDLWVPGPGIELLRGVPEELVDWLTEPGLLTARIRAARPAPFRLRIVDQRVGFLGRAEMDLLKVSTSACFAREIELLSGAEPWVFAQTLVPDATLELHPWLAELGDSPLGETLVGVEGFERGPFEFAPLPALHPLAARALRDAGDEPDFLWARRSWFALRGRRFLVQEVFLPALAP
ncbi:MAG: chorismate lyase [Steroidobacteraceae bacterium]|nr:chorismate lyase [Steroidobacteraceae bacterium]